MGSTTAGSNASAAGATADASRRHLRCGPVLLCSRPTLLRCRPRLLIPLLLRCRPILLRCGPVLLCSRPTLLRCRPRLLRPILLRCRPVLLRSRPTLLRCETDTVVTHTAVNRLQTELLRCGSVLLCSRPTLLRCRPILLRPILLRCRPVLLRCGLVLSAQPSDSAAVRTGTAAEPDTSVAAGSGSAEFEAPCSGILVLQCVPHSGLRMALRRPLTRLLPGTNSERPRSSPEPRRLPDGSRTERQGDDPNHGPRSFSLQNRPRSLDGIHSEGRRHY